VYKVNWVRNDTGVFYLTMAEGGGHYAFKPGTTDVEIIGVNSNLKQTPQSWRFTHHMP
jgi:hypothetical protein